MRALRASSSIIQAIGDEEALVDWLPLNPHQEESEEVEGAIP
jgi:hypothetical protein